MNLKYIRNTLAPAIFFCLIWLQYLRALLSRVGSLYISYDKDGLANFRKFFTSVYPYRKSSVKSLILLDTFNVPHWIIANGIFVNELAAETDSSIATFSLYPRSPYLSRLFSSIGAHAHLIVFLTPRQLCRTLRLYNKIIKTLQVPEDLLELNIDGVRLGIDIYESILRSGSPTVDLFSIRSLFQLYRALRFYTFFRDLVLKGKVSAAVLSHDCYIYPGSLAKICHRHGIPVYYVNAFEMMRSSSTHDLYRKFSLYPEYFRSVSPALRHALIEKAQKSLTKRLTGSIGIDMPYQTKSAFEEAALPRQTRDSSSLKVLIATHCFYDNPHAYSKMLFPDFYTWLVFLGKISNSTDYDWYVKPHKDFLPGTLSTLKRICALYPRLSLINPDVSFHQLRREGVDIALTCYGSIGHELPLIGYRVINASYNPHIAYTFNHHCSTKEEYRDLILNLRDLAVPIRSEEIYEFYAVHHYLVRSDNLLFNSFSSLLSYLEHDEFSTRTYSFFMREADANLSRFRSRARAFLSSNKQYEFELNLRHLGHP